MSDTTETTDEEKQRQLREMVLSAAAQIGLAVAEAGRESGLALARKTDQFEVEGVEWHVTATWAEETDGVRVSGHPHVREEAAQAVDLGAVVLLFGPPSNGGTFDFTVPAVWIAKIATATVADLGGGAP